MKLSIIVPVFNEESTIARVLDTLARIQFPCAVEIIVVDDGSTDHTAQCVALANRDNVFKVHTSLINLGKGAAVRFGLEYAEGDYVVIQDADLELNPHDLLSLLACVMNEGAEVVFGSRFKGRRKGSAKVPWFTILANRVLTAYTNILFGSRLTDMATAYKLIKADTMKRINLRCIGFEFDPEVTAKLLRLGRHIVEVPIDYEPRSVIQGKKIGWKDGFRFMYYLTKYRLASADSVVRRARKQEA